MAFDPFTAVIDLATNIGGWVNDSIKHKRELEAAEAANKVRLLQDTMSNNHAWEMANLTDKDAWLRRICFAVFMYPIFWAGFSPDGAREYFSVLQTALPEWYIQIVIAMVGGIWGIASLKNVIPSIASQVMSAVRNK